MQIYPRHCAALFYTMIVMFLGGMWHVLLSPVERAPEQLRYIFSPSYEYFYFFVGLVIENIFTLAVAVGFWFKAATSRRLARLLVLAAATLFIGAVCLRDSTSMQIYGIGLLFAVLSWWKPEQAL